MKRIALFLLVFFTVEAFGLAQGQRATVYELGPPVMDTSRQSAFNWRAWGFVYPRGTVTKDGCDQPEARSIGYWTAYVERGGAPSHVALYRVVIGGEQFTFNGEVSALDDDGFPASILFDWNKLEAGQFLPAGSVVYEPRSSACLGGQLSIFKPPEFVQNSLILLPTFRQKD